MARQPDQGGVTAIARSHYGNTRRVDMSLGHRPGYGVAQVIVHPSAPFTVAGVDERLTEPDKPRKFTLSTA